MPLKGFFCCFFVLCLGQALCFEPSEQDDPIAFVIARTIRWFFGELAHDNHIQTIHWSNTSDTGVKTIVTYRTIFVPILANRLVDKFEGRVGLSISFNVPLERVGTGPKPTDSRCEDAGRSGSRMYRTANNLFLAKELRSSVGSDEGTVLLKLTTAYREHFNKNPNSLLPMYLGIVVVCDSDDQLIAEYVVFPNLVTSTAATRLRSYDIKFRSHGGDEDARGGQEAILSSFNFKECPELFYGNLLQNHALDALQPEARQKLLAVLQKDVLFLERHDLVDYSLLFIYAKKRVEKSTTLEIEKDESSLDFTPKTEGVDLAKQEDDLLDLSEKVEKEEADDFFGGIELSNGDIAFVGIIDILMSRQHSVRYIESWLKKGKFNNYGSKLMCLLTALFERLPPPKEESGGEDSSSRPLLQAIFKSHMSDLEELAQREKWSDGAASSWPLYCFCYPNGQQEPRCWSVQKKLAKWL